MANWRKIKLLDIINPVKWWSMIDSWLTKRYSVFASVHVIEQIHYRFLNCPACLKAKACIGQGDCEGCGCDIPDKMLVLWETDDCGKWGPVLDKEEWEEYKRVNEVTFILKEKN